MEQRTPHPLENEAWSRAREGRKRAIFNIWLAGESTAFPGFPPTGSRFFARSVERTPKEQLSLCRLRRSLATCAELLKIIPDWDPLFRQFSPSGALLHFGRHRYQRQSRHYVKARSLKQSSFNFISLRHVENYKEGNFYLVLLTQLHSLGSFPTKEL